ncbi:Norsolorinic acid A [Cyphellophora attinorum]|uniref:Norsolorinic acid A n=1 Tax=Cyphellophora attinorum TaxID=1664694 RepID=A0A0N1H9A8_9EURO|nr:Norsolorinic acid A [Phialophora attinorum]KPI40092.1 Norsolorinic acid A [Phialophora attinorum]
MTASTPASPLKRHRLLAPSAAVLVSPLCLGGMNFGDAWKSALGECDMTTTFEILDTFYAAGGNFIDTSNNYQAEQSEAWIGEWLSQQPDRRDEIVIATKYAEDWKTHSGPSLQQSNYGGNSAKSLHISVQASLKKLQTTYIDLLYVHFWDYTAMVEEVMSSLNVLVTQGKVLYLGICNTPAWVVVKCNAFARSHGMRGFSVYQGRWSAADRDLEREIVPMCMSEGMGIAPWGVLGGGYFKNPEDTDRQPDGRNLESLSVGRESSISLVLHRIAQSRQVPLTSIALAYIMHKAPYVFPIVGGRKVSHLKANISALGIALSDAEMEEIEGAYDFDIGFPHNLMSGPKPPKNPGDNLLTQIRGQFDFVEGPRAIKPAL